LKRIRKGITPEQTRRAVAMTRKAGIGVLASFVLGLPGETPETLRQTIDFADSLEVPYSLNLLTPYVGTEIRDRCQDWKIRIHSDEWRFYGQGHPLTSTPTVSRRQLSRAVNRYRAGVGQYLNELFERERRGILIPENAEELERHRHWNILRRLIGEEILERYGVLPVNHPGNEIRELALSIAHSLGMKLEEVQKHLEPLISEGRIGCTRESGGKIRWAWAPN